MCCKSLYSLLYSTSELSYYIKKVCQNNDFLCFHECSISVFIKKLVNSKPTLVIIDYNSLKPTKEILEILSATNNLKFLYVGKDFMIGESENLKCANVDFVSIEKLDEYLKKIKTENKGKEIISFYNDKEINRKILDVLDNLNVCSTYYGYKYLSECIGLLIKNKEFFSSFDKNCYPTVASKFGTSKYNVEKNIRTLICKTYDENEDKWKEVLNISEKPSNRNLIFVIADKILSNI